MKPLTHFLFLLCLLCFGACKEEYEYPDVITEFTEIQTDRDGRYHQLITDQGKVFQITGVPETIKTKADTIFRKISVYQLLQGEPPQARIYGFHPVISHRPVPESKLAEGIKTDPVDLQSIWQSNRYLNLILLVQVKEKEHSYQLIEQGIYTHADGSHTLKLMLHHDRKGDYEAFTEKVNVSIPLWIYGERLKKGDRIQLRLNTYKEGVITKEFYY